MRAFTVFHCFSIILSLFPSFSLQGTPPGPGEPIRQVASLTLHEYAASFIWDDEYVGAYPTWNTNLQQTGAKMINFALKTRNCVSKSHKNEELCIKITQKRGILY